MEHRVTYGACRVVFRDYLAATRTGAAHLVPEQLSADRVLQGKFTTISATSSRWSVRRVRADDELVMRLRRNSLAVCPARSCATTQAADRCTAIKERYQTDPNWRDLTSSTSISTATQEQVWSQSSDGLDRRPSPKLLLQSGE